MPVPQLDDNTRADKLAYKACEFFVDTNVYIQEGGDLEAIYAELKLCLRLIAVRNPNAQSHALRSALGLLIEGICTHADSDKVRLDLLGLLVRMVDQKQGYKYNPMKHLAISGLGHLVKHVKKENRQLAANVFIVCVESWRVAPISDDTLKYRQTILWTLTQSVNENLTIEQAKYAARAARSVIDDSPTEYESVKRAYELLAALVQIESGQHYFIKRIEPMHALFSKHGSSSPDKDVRIASARFYAISLLNLNFQSFQPVFKTVCQSYTRHSLAGQYSYRSDGYLLLMEELIKIHAQDSAMLAAMLDEWLASMLVQMLDAKSASRIFKFVFSRLTDAAKLAAITCLLKLVAQAEPEKAQSQSGGKHTRRGSANSISTTDAKQSKQGANSSTNATNLSRSMSTKSKSSKPGPSSATARLESILACVYVCVSTAGSAIEPVVEPVHLAMFGLLINMTDNDSVSSLCQALITNCLVHLVRIAPKLLVPTLELALKQFDSVPKKKLAMAYILATTLAESRDLKMYGDNTIALQIINLAASHVKQRDDLTSYKVAWTLFCGVFQIGSEAVKPMVPQLLVLWETHLSKEACANLECLERALTGLLAFLVHNKPLLTRDVAFRIGKALSTVWDTIEPTPPNPLVRARLLECFNKVLEVEKDLCPASLLMKYIAHVTSTNAYDKGTGVNIPSAILTPKLQKEGLFKRKAKETELVETINPDVAIEAGLAFQLDNELIADVDFILLGLKDVDIDVYTRVVNSAVQVTAKMLPRQPARIQESVLSSIYSELKTAFSAKSARSAAVVRNIALFIETCFNAKLKLDERTILIGLAIIKQLISSDNYKVRLAGSKAAQNLFLNADTEAGTKQLMPFVNEIVDNIQSLTRVNTGTRANPHLGAGSITCLGYLSRVYPYRTILDAIERVVVPLHSYPDFQVSLACLVCIQQTLQTPSFLDLRIVKRGLKFVTHAYLQEEHTSSPIYQREIALLLAQCVSRMGPALGEDDCREYRHLIFALASILQRSSHVEVNVTGGNVLIEVYYFARKEISWSVCFEHWVAVLRNANSTDLELDSATTGLALKPVLNDSVINILWVVLDSHPKNRGIKKLLRQALDNQCTLNEKESVNQCILATLKWIQLVNTVFTKPRSLLQPPKPKQVQSAQSLDEDASLGVYTDDHNEQFCWEVRGYALDLLLRLLKQLNNSPAVKTRIVGEIVKLAFTAVTSPVVLLQQKGLQLMDEIVVQFGDLNDPDFPQVALLEQYQVQLVSALSSTFSVDGTPVTAMAALYTCGRVLGSRIFKTREKFAKLLKILSESVDSFNSETGFKLGELAMTSNASKVLEIGVLGVWAVLRVHKDGKTCEQDLSVRIDALVGLWEHHVLEFAKLNHDYSDISPVSFKQSVGQVEAILLRDLMRPGFEKTWMLFVKALAMEEDKLQNESFAFMLYGFSIQALTQPSDHDHLIVLETLETLLAKHQQFVEYIDELLPLLYRSVLLASNRDEQLIALKIVKILAKSLEQNDENVDIMFEMVKITVLPLRNYFPQIFDSDVVPTPFLDTQTKTEVVRSALNTMMDIVQRFPEIVQDDLWVCLIRIFEEVNQTEPALAAPSFKRLLEMLNKYVSVHESIQVLSALLSSFGRNVDDPSLNSLLVCTAVVCTCQNFFVQPHSLRLLTRYGNSLAEAIKKDAVQSIPVLVTALKSCSRTPVIVHTLVRACVPVLVHTALNSPTPAALRATDALTVYAALYPQPQIYALIIPVIIAVTNTETDEQRERRSRTQLLQLVTKDAACFKLVVQHMNTDDTTRLQELLRLEVPEDDSSSEEEGGITLTSFE